MTRNIASKKYWNKDLRPTKLSQRNWRTKDFAILWISMSATVVTYICGSTLVAEGMNLSTALLAVFLGSIIILIPILLNAEAGAKYGIPFPVYCRVSFGMRGANIPVLLRAMVACGWFGIVCWIGGNAIYSIISAFFPPLKELPNNVFGINIAQFISFILFWSIHFFALRRGIKSIKILLNIKAPLLIFANFILIIWILMQIKNHDIFYWLNTLNTNSVINSHRSAINNFPTAVITVISSWSTLALNISDFTRYSASQKSQIVGQALGLPLAMTFFSFVGIMVTLASAQIYGTPIWNPIDLAAKITNPFGLLFAILTIVIASLATNVAANIVSPANDFSHIWPSRISFKTGGYITMFIGIIIMPWKIMLDPTGYVLKWLTGSSGLLGGIAGILIADYYFCRRRIFIRQLYQDKSIYWYWRGFNIKSVIVFLCGILPCLPGFFANIDLWQVTNFWLRIYGYSWFFSFITAFLLYLLVDLFAKKLPPYLNNFIKESGQGLC